MPRGSASCWTVSYLQPPDGHILRPPAGAVGYVAMLRPASATNPYALTVILCAWVFIGSFLALKTEVRLCLRSPCSRKHTPECRSGVRCRT